MQGERHSPFGAQPSNSKLSNAFLVCFYLSHWPNKAAQLQRSGTRIRPAPLCSTTWHPQNVEEQLIDTVSSRMGHRGVRGSKGVIRPQSCKTKQVFRMFSLPFKKGKSGCWGLAIPGNRSKTCLFVQRKLFFLSCNLAAYPRWEASQ